MSTFKALAFEFSSSQKQAYLHTFKGEFNKSRKLLNFEIKKNAANSAAFYFLGYNSFLESVFAENPTKDEALIDTLDNLLNNIEKQKENELKKYALGELHMHLGMIKLRQGSYVSGLFELRKAYALLEKNKENYPDFLLTDKTYYILQALLSNVPEQYKDLIEFFGYGTDQYLAIAKLDTLQESLKSNIEFGFFRKEVELFRAVLMHTLTDKYAEAYDIIKENTPDYKTNPVSCFIRGKIALDSKKTGEAIEILKCFSGPDCPFPYINYDLANAYLRKLDKKCLLYFGYFIKQNPGEGLLNDSYLKLAWWGHIKGDDNFTKKWLAFINESTESHREKDKVAVKEAKALDKTHPILLEARITFDGGYYEYAIDILEENKQVITEDAFNTIRYHYQLGRLHQDLNQYNVAITQFKIVAELDFNKDEYFIPVACFNTALIYENKLFDKSLAKAYYSKCLEYKGYPFASTYRYKSDLAIERLESAN